MKLSVITDEISMDLEQSLNVMSEYGAYGAELRGLWGKNISELTVDEVARAKAILDKKGFSVSAIASPFFKCALTDDEAGETGMTHLAPTRSLSEQHALLERLIRYADVFQTRLIRVFTFWRKGPLTAEIEDRIVEAFREPVKMAAECGIILALENEHDCYVSTGAETGRVIRRVDSPHLKVVWDPGNAFFAGDIPPFPDGYEAVRGQVVHVHVKDAVRLPSGEYRFVVVGEGSIDYPGQFAALKADGYDGFVSLETHFRDEGKTAEDCSRLCLEPLRKMIAEVQ